MIDIRLVRTDPDAVKAALGRRSPDLVATVDELAKLDREARDLSTRRDDLRAQIKKLSQEVGAARKAGTPADDLAERSRLLTEELKALDDGDPAAALHDLLLRTPNLPAPEVPDGASDADNVVVRVEGYDPEAYGPHQRIPHWDSGAELGILDVERAARMSGSMFAMLRGPGATLARALQQLALDRNADAFEEIRPPTVVRTATMISTGHLPKFEEEAYHAERDDLWLIPTAEVPLTSLYAGEILSLDELPRRVMAATPCYRREAGAAGRDTRGLLRVHEFDKVEILAYATAEQASEMHAELLSRAEATIAALGLAYRIVDICAADLGNSAARTFDIEVYAPGCDQWLEVSSVSWFSDYQARRANIRHRLAGGGTAVAHTLNGSALAVPRVWAALVETHRQPDGAILLPAVLLPYFRGADRIAPRGT